MMNVSQQIRSPIRDVWYDQYRETLKDARFYRLYESLRTPACLLSWDTVAVQLNLYLAQNE